MKNTDKVKILFCNIGWMRDYEGADGDPIIRGGKYNEKNIGFEACNFSKIKGYVYGYVQNVKNISTINLERITKKKEDQENKSISGVTVVWTATRPHSNYGRVVVGWYKNATVYRSTKESPIQWRKNKDACYNILASASDATLLPKNERKFSIHQRKNYMGRNVWYADRDDIPEVKKFVSEVIEFVNERKVLKMPDLDRAANEGKRRAVTHFCIERDP